MSQKWQHALSNPLTVQYDAFFDFSMSVWVKSLDDYILHWTKSPNLEYFGIEWHHNALNLPFYSILVHLPSSSTNFEFISSSKPTMYHKIRWITEAFPRCTFEAMNAPYPWNRDDGATIVPVQISHATTNTHKLHDFYTQILGAQLLSFYDAAESQTIFLQLPQTQIEIAFTQRPPSLTYGDMALAKYENLLLETHDSIISSPFCGQDRWMDNHFAFETYVIPGLLDAIFANLVKYNIKFTVHKNVREHTSDYIKHQLDLIAYTGEYTFGLWLIEPSGQSIKLGGVISDPSVAMYAGTNDPQWCEHECHWGLKNGVVDPSHVYVDDARRMHLNVNRIQIVEKGDDMYIGVGVILCVLIIFAAAIYYKHCVGNEKEQHEYSIVLNPVYERR